MLETLNLVILIAAGLVAVSVFTSLVSFRIGAPLLLVFLLVGLAAGEDGPGGIAFSDARAAYFIGSIALAIILFDSGFRTRFNTFRLAAAPALVLATLGVGLTAGVVGLAAHFFFDWRIADGLLLGAIVGSTDAAAVFFLLRVGGIHLREMISATLEVESGSNDPMAIFLTMTLVSLATAGGIMGPDANLEPGLAGDLALELVRQMGLGLVAGLAGGYAIVQIVNRVPLEPALYPIVVLALALTLFGATSLAGGSGFLAAYVAGLLCGNVRIRQQPALKNFQGGMTWLGQIGMFVTLGLLATPSQFAETALPGFTLAFVLIFVARPFAVWLCLVPFGFTRAEIAFVSWVGLRGAVSILLAILPLIAGLENAQTIFNVTFLIVLTSLVLQGWTIRPMAEKLKLTVPPRMGPVERIELELPGGEDHELVGYTVHPQSAVARGERVPRWARPVLILRDGHAVRLQKAGKPQAGDRMYILATARQVPVLDTLFAGAAQEEHDPALFGDFPLDPEARLADIAGLYGIRINKADADLSVRALLARELGDDIEPADRVAYGDIDLVVRDIDDDHGITAVGLAVEHVEPTEPVLPFFFSREDFTKIGRKVATRVRRRRARAKVMARRLGERAGTLLEAPGETARIETETEDGDRPAPTGEAAGVETVSPPGKTPDTAPEKASASGTETDRDTDGRAEPDIYRGPLS
ncbi:MAG: potassium/proton antiporter [Stappia sp.]|uniref:potassium/proton antiporter n=1 Tax=Stappia sp. TaxID=1870903 RepID=UPI000C531422|nr:potassium/proton antiporter [Stappia sp.]MAA97542.1 potassium/proton antiporter [Stappia sp.]MBM22075.1 potassium/proton antiporter [Stappia sp.]